MKSEFQKRLISSILLIPTCFLLIIEGSILFNLFLCLCFVLTILEWNKMYKKIIINFILVYLTTRNKIL